LEIIMYDHIGLKVKNLDASVRFYSAALAPLGYVLCSRDESGAGFGPKGEPALWLYLHKGRPAPAPTSRSAPPITRRSGNSTAAGRKAGGRDNGAAGPRADYSPTYFAAFLIDPDGNNVEAVCTYVNYRRLGALHLPPKSLRAKRSNRHLEAEQRRECDSLRRFRSSQ
jgi:catechol 2,3-dioxygenase-like lactoylglutathione lyase family enzyme